MKLYVPNPQLWVDYFDRITKGTSNQRGGGRRPRIIMVKPSRKKEDQHISIKAVLPTEQTAAQAKSELVREDINPKDVEKVFQNLPERQRVNKQNRKRPASSSAFKKSKRHKSERQKRSKSKQTTAAKRPRDIFEIE